MNSPFRYYPALDGLRGVSVILVLIYHAQLLSPALRFLFPGGFLGVDMFFVISGFLISSLLLDEITRYGRIDFRAFYMRRILRLSPAYISVLLFTLLLAAAFGFESLGLTPLRLFSIFGYFTNWVRAYEGPQVWLLAHLWSLAIEEQFYLIWPVTLFTLLRLKLSTRSIATVLSVLLLLALVWKIALFLNGASSRRITFGSDTRGDAILVGCIIALFVRGGFNSATVVRALSRAGVILFVALAMVASDNYRPIYLGGYTVAALACGTVVLSVAVVGEDSVITRFANNRALRWIGKRSYGLYLWHWPIYELCRLLPKPLILISAVAGSFIVAALSYRFIEAPFLKLKRQRRDYSATQPVFVPVAGGVTTDHHLPQ